MVQTGIQLIWLALYQYYIEQVTELEKGYRKRIVTWGLTLGILAAARVWALWEAIAGYLGGDFAGHAGGRNEACADVLTAEYAGGSAWRSLWGWLVITLVLLLYVLFYDGKPFRQQWRKALVPGLLISLCAMAQTVWAGIFLNGAVMAVFLLLLALERGYLRIWIGMLNTGIYAVLCLYIWNVRDTAGMGMLAGIAALELLLFLSLEGTLFSYHQSYEVRTEQFQRDILGHQYEEIRDIYLNMRGWRHDYHNHMQVMKVQLSLGQLEEMRQYLDELEQDLDSVDTYVKSGNLMTDAILNSKLTLARQKKVRINCKAVLPEDLSVEDVDMCVLLGNLLDNALEACEKIPEQMRFLRIYMAVKKSQLYISVQNSAKEELDFNERNYISSKRGNHGLGMKRVKALTDKYEGYLTLANEPGIFAAEVTLPL